MPFGGPNSERILILAPRGRDAEIASRLLLEAGWPTLICTDVARLCDERSKGAGLSRRIGARDSGLIQAAQAEQLSQGPLQQNPRIEAKEAGHRTWLPLLVM